MSKEAQYKTGDKVTLDDGRKAVVMGVSAGGGGVLLEAGEKGKPDYETSWFGVDKLVKPKRTRKAAESKPAGDQEPAGKTPPAEGDDKTPAGDA